MLVVSLKMLTFANIHIFGHFTMLSRQKDTKKALRYGLYTSVIRPRR